MRIALLSSVGSTLDSFFPEIVDEWTALGSTIVTAASTASTVGEFTLLSSVSRRPSIDNVRAPGAIRSWLRRTGAEALITNTATASALSRVGRLPVPVVYFCHGLHWNAGASVSDRVWQSMESRLIRNTAAVITINRDDEAWFRARMAHEQVLRLKFGVGVPMASYPRAPLNPGSEVKLLWVGEFSTRKQPHQAIEVVKALRTRGVGVSLTMLGDGPLHASVTQAVVEAGLSAAIRLPGRGPVQRYLADCDALLHTAQWEGLPRALLEGLAVGRISYAYDVKGVRDVPGGRLSAENQPEALADAISRDVESGSLARAAPRDVEGLDSRNAAGLVHAFVSNLVHQS